MLPLATGLAFMGPVPGVVLEGLRLLPLISSLLKPPCLPGIELSVPLEYCWPPARIRRGGKQTVRVVHVHQHVAVAEGGQAVVAGGNVKGGGRKRGEFPRSARAGGASSGKSDQGE